MSETVSLGYAVWAGGSGNISSDWITGYVENIGTDGIATFVSWVVGPPPVESSEIVIESTLEALGVVDTDVGTGGTLTGILATSDLFGVNSDSTYLLSGNLSVEEASLSSGTLDVDGVGSILNVGSNDFRVDQGLLAISSGASVVSATGTLDSIGGYSYNGSTYLPTTVGTLEVSGVGSTLTTASYITIYAGSLEISNGASVSAQAVIGYDFIGSDGNSGTLTVSGKGSSLTVSDVDLNTGTISNGASVSAPGGAFIEGSAATLTVIGAGSTLTAGELEALDGGAATISDGASVSAQTEFIGYETDGGTGTLTVSGTGTVLNAGSIVYVGGLGGTGTIDVSGGAHVTTEGPAILSGNSSLSVDATSAAEIGGSTNLNSGTIVVDSGFSISGGGTINGDVDNSGIITASGTTGALTLNGPMTGSGTLEVGLGADLILNAGVASDLTVTFADATGTLGIGSLADFAPSISDFQMGDTIDLLGVAANTRVFNAGTLVLSETSGTESTMVGSLIFNGIGADQTFELSPDGANGTDITLNAATVGDTPSIFAPGTATVGVGQANPVNGITIGESPTTTGETFTVVLTDTNGVLSANTSATGGGGSVTPSNGGRMLTITGSLAQVNADLSTLRDDDASTALDTITINASDSNDGVAMPASIAVTVNGLPVIAAPTSATLQQNKATAVGGISVSETGNTSTSGETFTVVLTDTTGVLAADISATGGGGTVTPSNDGKTLTIIGTLAQVNADLTTLTDSDGTTPSDTIALTVTDKFGNKASNSIPVTNGTASGPPPTIMIVNPGTVERSQTTVIATVAPGIAGDSLTPEETSGAGTIMLGAVQPDGTQQVIYTAPASIPTSKVDTVAYSIMDSDGATAAPVPASVQLDAGPALKAQAPTVIEQGQTTVIGTVTPGLKGDTLTMLVTETSGGGLTLNSKDQIVYTAPPTTTSKNYTVSYTISDQYKDAAVSGQATLVVDGGPSIAPETPAWVGQGQTTDIGVVTPGLPGDTLTLKQTAGAGTLSLGAVQANGTQQVIYTAPATVSASIVDKVAYTVTDQHKDDMATGSASVQLEATNGPVSGPPGGGGNIILGNGNDTVNLSGSNNVVTIGSGNSKVSGGQNANVIAIGNGNSSVSLSGSDNSVTLGNGNGTVVLGGSDNTVTVGNGNSTISLGGGGDTVTAGNGNDTITLAGSGSTVKLGNGTDTVHGGSGDTIYLATTTLTLYGTDEMVFIGTGNATVNDFSTGLDLKIGPTAGVDVLSNFASDPSGVVDLIGGIGGFKTTAAVLSVLKSDGHGGTLLSFGAGSSLDFASVALSQLHASNFKIG